MKTQSRPFTVTVKRQKRAKGKSIWSDTPNMADMLAQAGAGDEPAGPSSPASDALRKPSEPDAAAPRAKSKAKTNGAHAHERRILADLTPVEMRAAEVEPEQPKRPRGRPRKVLMANGDAEETRAVGRSIDAPVSDAATAETVRPMIATRRPRRAMVQPSAKEIADALSFDEAGERDSASAVTVEVADEQAASVGVEALASIDGRGGDTGNQPRRRPHTALRRGERWKRHLPRWKR